jgi:hypothetical protein
MRRIRKRLRIAPVLVASKKASGACNQWQSVAISGNQWRSRTRRVEEGERRMEQRRRNPPMELA